MQTLIEVFFELYNFHLLKLVKKEDKLKLSDSKSKLVLDINGRNKQHFTIPLIFVLTAACILLLMLSLLGGGSIIRPVKNLESWFYIKFALKKKK